MIDIRLEQTFSLTQAAKLDILPRRREGKRPNASTLWRWALHGVRGIRLETAMAGAVRVTSLGAIQRFFDALTAADTNPHQTPPPAVPTNSHLRKIEEAERRLAATGFCSRSKHSSSKKKVDE